MVNLAAVNLPLRGIQMLLAILNLGLSGYMVSVGYGKYCSSSYSYFYDAYASGCTSYHTGEYGYALFTSIWTVLVVAILIPAALGRLPEKLPIAIITTVIDGLTMVFWFSSWIAVAVIRGLLGDFCYSSAPCATTAAFAAFGAVEWLLFLASLVLGIIAFKNSRAENTRAPAPTPAPGHAPGPTPVV